MQATDIKIWRNLVESAQLAENDQQIKKIIKNPFQITKIKSIDSAIWSNNQVKKAVIKFMLDQLQDDDDLWPEEKRDNLLTAAHLFDTLKKLNCPWPELTVIFNYIRDGINNIVNNSSPRDRRNHAYATYEYVKDVIHKIWPLVEPIIMQEPETTYLYAVKFKGPWPEAEPMLMKDGQFTSLYAEYVIKRPWPDAEPYINKGPYWAKDDYNEFVKKFNNNKQPIKENAEQIQLLINNPLEIIKITSVDSAVWSNNQAKKAVIKFILEKLQSKYDNNKIRAAHAFDELRRKNCPWPELHIIQTYVEDTVKQIEPLKLVYYVEDFVFQPWPLVEPPIMTDPEAATYYARYVLKRPWPAAEAVILTDAGCALNYAEYVLKRRWILAEPVIMKSAWTAYHYAKDILKRPWPEAEATIMNDLLISKDYMEFKSQFEKD